MKLLLDQGLPRSAVSLLLAAGIKASHVGDVGHAMADDTDIIEHARLEGAVVVTLDADFHALLALSGATGPSVIRIRMEGLRAEPLADLLVQLLHRCAKQVDEGALVTVRPHSVGLRRLPILR